MKIFKKVYFRIDYRKNIVKDRCNPLLNKGFCGGGGGRTRVRNYDPKNVYIHSLFHF